MYLHWITTSSRETACRYMALMQVDLALPQSIGKSNNDWKSFNNFSICVWDGKFDALRK